MAMVRRSAVFLGVLTLCGNYGSEAAVQDTLAHKLWQKIQSVEADDPGLLETAPYEYWCEVAYNSRQEFYREMKALGVTQRPEVVKHYVQQFGKHGAISDFRWLCCDMQLTLPRVRRTAYEGPSADREWMIPVRELLCQEIVTRCLAERSFLKRYYHAVVWSGAFLGRPEGDHGCWSLMVLHSTEKKMSTRDDDDYWWWTRNAVLLLYAFGHEGLLKNADADDLRAATVRLAEWVHNNPNPLIADEKGFRWRVSRNRRLPVFPLPQAPFPDWDNRTPIPDRKVVHLHQTIPPADERD